MPLAPPLSTPLADAQGHAHRVWERFFINLAGGVGRGTGGSGGGTPAVSEPLVTGADPTEFITADGDVIVAVVGG